MLDTLFRDLSKSGNKEESFRLKDKSLCDGEKRGDIAARAGITRESLYKLLRGDTCRRKTAEKIAAGLEKPFNKVFDDVTEKRGLSGSYGKS
jgi:predicted transcriptional regulator